MMRQFFLAAGLIFLTGPAAYSQLVFSPPVASTATATPAALDGYSRNARDLIPNIGLAGSLTDATAAQYAAMADATHIGFIRGNHVTTIGGTLTSQLSTMQAIRAAQTSARKVMFGSLVMAYMNDPATWSAQSPLFQAMLGAGILKFIEGPNEMNNVGTGGGSHGPADTTNQTSAALFPGNMQNWMSALVAFKAANAAAFSTYGTALVGPSVAPIAGTEADYPVNGSVTLPGAVDFCNLHYYAGSGRQPSLPYGTAAGLGYFGNVYGWAQTGYGPSLQCIQTEGGATTNNVMYAPTGVSQAKYIANQFMEAWKIGAKAVSIYEAFDGDSTLSNTDPEAHFGVYKSDHVTPKPAGTMIGRIIDILSLNNSASSFTNTSDNAPFRCGINTHQIAFVGLTSPPTSDATSAYPGELTICKSDGSVVLAVWNEAEIDTGQTGASPPADYTPAADPVTVYLPRARQWRIHDPLASDSLTAGAFTNSASVALNLYGYPQFIEVAAPAGYTQLAGDPADVPLFGSATFALGNTNQNYAANYGGAQPNALAIPLTPPAGHIWTPGNVAIIFATYGNGTAPTVAGSTATYGPFTFAGDGESVIGFAVPITNANQQMTVSGTGNFAQAAVYEVPPFTTAAVSAMAGSVNSANLISGTLAAIPAGAIGLFYVGMNTTYSVQNVAASSDTSVAILQQKQTGDGNNTYNTGFSGTVSAGRAAGAVTWQTPDYSPTNTQPIVVTFSAMK